MTFDAFETSVESGNVVEFYRFQQGAVITRLTNYNRDLIFQGVTWSTTQISRQNIERAVEAGINDLKIFLPLDNPIAAQFIPNVPGKTVNVQVYRGHATDPDEQQLLVFDGFVAEAEFDGDLQATLTLQPFTSQFKRVAPRFVYSGQCNNVLYDAGCQVSRLAFTYTGVVTAVNESLRQVTVAGLSINGANWAEGGFIAFPAGGNDDQRLVLRQSGGGDVCTLLSNFSEQVLGQTVDVVAGCAHDIATCNSKFSNSVNFGGYPFVPQKNPFGSTLRGGS